MKKKIAADPYAHANADFLQALLKPVLVRLARLPLADRKRLFAPLVEQLEKTAALAEAEYFQYLHRELLGVPIDSGPVPQKFIAVQEAHPKFRRLYEARRLTRCVYHAFAKLLSGRK